MSWVNENSVSYFQQFCIQVLKTGRVPLHVGFIMDGNRRCAKKIGMDVVKSHYRGFDKLAETIMWCVSLGIPEITVFALSIENFKRPKQEVDGLFVMAREKFQLILDEIDQINKWGVKIHLTGELSLIPDDLKILMSRVMVATRHNNNLRLNFAFPYTGRNEISRAAAHVVGEVKKCEISPEDIDTELVSRTLDLGDADLVIRTSGSLRLSDFMLWQVSNAVLYFENVYWPEYTIWNFLAAIIHFQRYAPPPKKTVAVISDTQQRFLDKLEYLRWQQVENLARG